MAEVLTPRGEGGAAPWAVVERIMNRSNVFRHVGGGVQILGRDTGGQSQQTGAITIVNNLFDDIRQDYAFDIVRVIQVTDTAGVTVDHNTFVYAPGSWPMVRSYGAQTTDFVYTNNIIEYRKATRDDPNQAMPAQALTDSNVRALDQRRQTAQPTEEGAPANVPGYPL